MNQNKKLNKINEKAQANLLKAFESIIPKYSQGGQLISAGLSMIPGYGQFLGPAAGIVDKFLDKNMINSIPQMQQINTNPYGNLDFGGPLGGPNDPVIPPVANTPTESMSVIIPVKGFNLDLFKTPVGTTQWVNETNLNNNLNFKEVNHNKSLSKTILPPEKTNGGFVNNNFKQYDTGAHGSGNDMKIDQNGNESNNPTAAVQNKENSFLINNKPYIMSDTLVNPKTGNYFNQDAAKVNKKYKDAHFYPEEKNALNFNMKSLASLNDAMRTIKEGFEKVVGGYLGDPIRNLPMVGVDGKIIQPNNQPIIDPVNNDSGVPIGNSNPLDPDVVDQPLAIDSFDPVKASQITLGSNLNNTGTVSSRPPQKRLSLDRTAGPNEFTTRDANAIAIGLKGAGLVKSFADAITPSEMEQPILPDYKKSDNYMQQANIDYTQAKQDAIGASNVGRNVNRSSTSGFASYQNREMGRVANLVDSLSNINQQENNQQSQLNLTKGQYEQSKAIDTANRLTQNRINNQQNQAVSKYADEKLFTELSQIGTEFNQYGNHLAELKNNKELANYYIKEGMTLLNSNLANFKLDPEFVTKLKSGASFDDLVKFYPTEVVKLKTAVDKQKGT